MRLVFVILFFSLSGALLSQPVFQEPAMAPLGYSADIIAADFIPPTPPSAEPQAWDFSWVSGSAAALLVVEPASQSPYADAFSGAEWVNTVGDQLTFWSLDDGVFTVQGNANVVNGATLSFEDPLVQWSYPLEYGSASTDSFSVDMNLFGLPYSLLGEASLEVNAWGSLVMPGGEDMGDVLRADYSQTYLEAYDGDSNTWVLNQTVYFAGDSLLPVFFHEDLEVLDLDGNQLLEFSDVAWYAYHMLSTPDLEFESFSPPYPNPVNQGADLHWSLPSGWAWEAMGMDGRKRAEGKADEQGRVAISTEGWGPGMVLLSLKNPQGKPSGKPVRVFVQ